jgi:hypothetical protein
VITKVAELINPVTRQWDIQLVNDIFREEDAAAILAIPLRDEMEDFLAWYPQPKGNFSVRSA